MGAPRLPNSVVGRYIKNTQNIKSFKPLYVYRWPNHIIVKALLFVGPCIHKQP